MKRLIAASLVSVAAGLGGAAFAQAQQPQQAQRPFSKPTERVEARLAYVRTALKITDAQQPQWNAYADSVRKEAAQREGRMAQWHDRFEQMRKDRAAGKPVERPSALERLERAEKMHADAAARIGAHLAAVKPLYASLSAEQKKVADEVLVPQGGRPGGFRRHHGGGEHHGRA